MGNRPVTRALMIVVALSLSCLLASCENVSVSGGIKCRKSESKTPSEIPSCLSYQQSDPLPDQAPPPPSDVIRVAVGGDSRSDKSCILPWSFKEARRRGAKAFFFLGDLEITEAKDYRFSHKDLGDIPFYPAIGNHEVDTFGIIRDWNSKTLEKVENFKKSYLTARGIHLAPFPGTVVYSVDFEDKIHFIALDNVSRKGGGFGVGQLAWLEDDLSKANAEKKIILVGMHKGLANNPVTSHAMDEDGPRAVEDSEAALVLLKHYKAAMVFVSHSHMYAAYPQDGLQVRLTGGMGAPPVPHLAEADGAFHHFLLVDVSPSDTQTSLHVEVVKWPCKPPCTPSVQPCKPSVEDNDE